MGRAVILVYHASGFLRLCMRAVHIVAWLTLIPHYSYNRQQTFNPRDIIATTKEIENKKQNQGGVPLFAPKYKRGPGLLSSQPRVTKKQLIGHYYFYMFYGTDTRGEGTVPLSYFGVYYLKVNTYRKALREVHLSILQVFLLLEPFFIPAWFSLQDTLF